MTDPDRAAQAVGVLLLDLLGRRRRTGPDDDITYTNNWPHEPLVGNRPTGEAVVWTGVSIIMLLAGICGDGLVVRVAAEEAAPSRRAPETIRCGAGRPRRRSRRRSNTSGSWRR